MSPALHNRRVHVALVGLLAVVAVGLRLPALGDRSWWIDELVTTQVSRFPLYAPGVFTAAGPTPHSILGFCIRDTGPGPFSYLLEGLFSRKAHPGGGEFWIRLPGILCAAATVLLLGLRGRRWCGSRHGALAMAAFAAAFPMWADWSTGARGYSWTVLLCLLQLGMIVELTSGGRGTGRKRAWLGALVPLSCIASVLLSPMNAAWCAAIVGALAAVWVRSLWRRGPAFPGAWFLSASVAAAVVCGEYLHRWALLSRKPVAPADAARALNRIASGASAFLDSLAREPSGGIGLGACMVCVAAGLHIAWRKPGVRPAAGACLLALAAVAALALLLLSRFFLVLRYFYPVTVMACWCAGLLAARGCAFVRRRAGRRVADGVLAVGICALVAVCTPSSLYFARTPVHDWSNAARWMTSRIRPGDLVFCGPNADNEVLWTYAEPLGWLNQVPRWLETGGGGRLDTLTAEGLRAGLSSGRRLWFITPFLDAVRPPSYWRLVHENFREAERIPGRGDIHIFLREPPRPPATR